MRIFRRAIAYRMIHSIRRARPRVGKRTWPAHAGAAKMPRRGKRGRHGRGRMRHAARRLSAQRRQCGPPRLPRKKSNETRCVFLPISFP
ncbi:hypothetical protein SZ28_02830 [Burkholderia pseudomallei]|nr:hypothetical protein SZ28_02830 [Burkholderia pseudomallei]ONA06614.1 hypothetical protein AQ876_15235 [Burkholderia pseudomallei]